ncbi:MFS transporter [Runella salmonicolor]|uniref:MFS transporter n=1 Tax=Runella salmonicolor TaxID=2950278 RepID=A0ABT1FKG9_9BACT|nr:MFS transporter [Runella salmonicolor]MCP1382270.1 MFS transporter [Runella salmonicolor]
MQSSFRGQQWKMLLVTMFCYLFFYTGRHNFGWAAKGMATSLNVSYSYIGWISFSMLLGYAIGQFINGNLADRLSARVMVTTGAYLSVLTNIAVSYSDSITTIMILWALNGYFQSMAWAPGGKLISNWWNEAELGKAFGFYTMAAGLSSVLTYLLSIVLLQQGMEWRMLFRLPVLFLLVAATIFLIVARDKPSDAGFIDPVKKDGTSEKISWLTRYRVVLSYPHFLLTSFAFGFESMARYGLIFWVPVHYLGKNWKDNPGNLWVTFLLPVGMAAGALSFGMLSDSLFKKNRIHSIRFGMLMSAVMALLVYVLPANNLLLGGFLMLSVGFFVYGPQSCFWPLSPEMLGWDYTGTGIGFMNMFGYVFAALGEPLFGFIIDWVGNTNIIFVFISGICLLSVVMISLAKRSWNAAGGVVSQPETLPS